MELYVVVCEVNQKKIVKRIYKTLEECHQYLNDLHEKLAQVAPGTYRIVSYSGSELVIEDLNEEISHEKLLRTYTIVGGETAEIMDFIASIAEQSNNHDEEVD